MPKRNLEFGKKSTSTGNRDESSDYKEDEDPVFFEWGKRILKISKDHWSFNGREGWNINIQAGYYNKEGEWRPQFNKNKKPIPPLKLSMTDDEKMVEGFFQAIWSKIFPEE